MNKRVFLHFCVLFHVVVLNGFPIERTGCSSRHLRHNIGFHKLQSAVFINQPQVAHVDPHVMHPLLQLFGVDEAKHQTVQLLNKLCDWNQYFLRQLLKFRIGAFRYFVCFLKHS